MCLKVSEYDLHEVPRESAGRMVVAHEHRPGGLQTTADHWFYSRRQIGPTRGNYADTRLSIK
jgi:hypothetical protein